MSNPDSTRRPGKTLIAIAIIASFALALLLTACGGSSNHSTDHSTDRAHDLHAALHQAYSGQGVVPTKIDSLRCTRGHAQTYKCVVHTTSSSVDYGTTHDTQTQTATCDAAGSKCRWHLAAETTTRDNQ